MTNRAVIATGQAPAAIGPYSQAVKVGNTVWMSGQIPLDPETGEVVQGGIEAQAERVFKNMEAVAAAAGGNLNDAVKVNISVINMGDFAIVNDVMARFFAEPYPARACVEVAGLPKGVAIEVEAILCV